jgi:hypothetical protein
MAEPWNGSWNGTPRNSGAISASDAIRRAICAGHGVSARDQAPRNASPAGFRLQLHPCSAANVSRRFYRRSRFVIIHLRRPAQMQRTCREGREPIPRMFATSSTVRARARGSSAGCPNRSAHDDERRLTAATDGSVLAGPDLGSIVDVTAGLILVSSRPREPIEKPWMRVP